MNHFLLTYIDFIQSIGFLTIFLFTTFVVRKIFISSRDENYIKTVKINVEE